MPIPGARQDQALDAASASQVFAHTGRESEAKALRALILAPESSLIAVTGGAGVGKSRLVSDVCYTLADQFEGGVWFADLSDTLRSPTLAWGVLEAFGAKPSRNDSPEHTVLNLLSSRKPLLLVLDGFERFEAEGIAHLQEWMHRAPRSRFLITLRGEREFSLGKTFKLENLRFPPHPAPGEEITEAYVEALKTYPAVEAFFTRAREVRSDTALSVQNARAVAVICSVMEGVPLALEILASRTAEIALNRMAPQLEQKRAFINSRRLILSKSERIMRTAIEWSYEFLPEWGKVALEQTTVFDAPFDLSGAQRVLNFPDFGGEEMIERALEGLHRMRLLASYNRSMHTKYLLHDAVREFVSERWQERCTPDEDRELKDRHAGYIVRLLEDHGTSSGTLDMLAMQADSQLETYKLLKLQDQWYGTKDAKTRLMTLSPQLKTALSIGLANNADYGEALELAREAAQGAKGAGEFSALGAAKQHLADIAEYRGDYKLALKSISEAQQAYQKVDAQPALAALNLAKGRIHTRLGEFRSALQEFASAKQIYRSLGMRIGEADAQLEAGRLLRTRGELRSALRCFEIAHEMYRKESRAKRVALSATLRASVLAHMGRFNDARESFEQAIMLSTEQGDRLATAEHTLAYGRVLRIQGRYPEAQRYITESEEVFSELGVKASVASALAELGLLNSELGFYRDALEQQRAALRLNRELSQRHGVMQTQLNLGVILVEMARYSDAKRPLKRASVLAHGFEDMSAHAEAEVNLALLELYGGDLKVALAMEKRARSIVEHLDDVFVRSLVLGVSGEIRLAGEKLEEAVELLESSMALARDYAFDSKIPCFRVVVCLAEAYWKLGRGGDAEIALMQAGKLSAVGGIMGNRRLTRSREFIERMQMVRAWIQSASGVS